MKKIYYFLFALLWISACKEDKCETVICQNDGICVSGECDCPDGYTGEFCETQKTPLAVIITKIEITRYPEMNFPLEQEWDEDSAPDLYINVRHPLDSGDSGNSPVLNDYSGGTPLIFDWSFTLNKLEDEYIIYLYDDDDGFREALDSGIFAPYQSENGLPSTIEILQPNWYVDFILHLEYVFN